ncbi:hypothetical protein [Sphingobacterium sp. MYb382]|uniref:hypothetical protein n=1 Tax=Sphingobacterium sp. MYb382 TaxID=2745278 RepID=UPI003096038F
MKGKIIVSKFWTNLLSRKQAVAITLFPFILLLDKSLKNDRVLLNHERIHLTQALELLVVPFYLWYFIEFFIHYIAVRDMRKAYFRISFEREAYSREHDLAYLQQRKLWAFWSYLKR